MSIKSKDKNQGNSSAVNEHIHQNTLIPNRLIKINL